MGMPSVDESTVHFPAFPEADESAVYFPVEEQVPETKQHLVLRTLVFEYLSLSFGAVASVGCDQFVYWNPRDPRFCLAPDAFLHLGEPDQLFPVWNVWERGAPQLALEIISASDKRDADWELKLEKYQRLGVLELLRFDPNVAVSPLRMWRRVEQELVEVSPSARSTVVDGYWQVFEHETLGWVLRLSRDTEGKDLYPTPAEQERQAAAEQAKAAAEQAKAAAEQAQARIRELEEELARRSNP